MNPNETDTGTTQETAPQIDSVEAAFDASNAEAPKTEATSDTQDKAAPARETPTQTPLLFGKYKTMDEAEKAFKESERKMHEATQRAADFEKRVNETTKQSPPAEPEFPELSTDELAQLKEDDPKLYQDYLETRNQLQTKKLIDKEVGPLRELEKQVKTEKYLQMQTTVFNQTKDFFGKEFEALEKQRQDPAFLQEVLEKSPIGDLIVNMHENGMKAEAHRLLLQQIEYHNLRNEKGKRARSVPADPSSSAKTTKVAKKAASIEDAFDSSMEELS